MLRKAGKSSLEYLLKGKLLIYFSNVITAATLGTVVQGPVGAFMYYQLIIVERQESSIALHPAAMYDHVHTYIFLQF